MRRDTEPLCQLPGRLLALVYSQLEPVAFRARRNRHCRIFQERAKLLLRQFALRSAKLIS